MSFGLEMLAPWRRSLPFYQVREIQDPMFGNRIRAEYELALCQVRPAVTLTTKQTRPGDLQQRQGCPKLGHANADFHYLPLSDTLP